MPMNRRVLDIDAAAEADRIVNWLRENMRGLHRSGAVLGISGGIDSSVCLALCVKAFGPERVVPLLLPEKDSDPASEQLARDLAAHYGVEPVLEIITPALNGYACYERRDAAIARIFPEYDAKKGYKAKIVLPPGLLEQGTLNIYSLTILTPDGQEKTARLPPAEFAQIVAASNFKQRTRTAMLYYHAELRNYAVVGTPNKNEHDQGFFVKHGDGGVDLKPIVHLYKTQVYQLARHLGVPEIIQQRTPTSDTYSAPATQEEFFFRLPFDMMDLLWYAQENHISPEEAAAALDLTPDQVQNAFDDFTRKTRSTHYLRTPPLDMVGLGNPAPVGV
ncbi:MAG TPA: NAD(+) synthase [Geothrix sp.]|nr:NAD(+) synthase [Geothrix sp.]